MNMQKVIAKIAAKEEELQKYIDEAKKYDDKIRRCKDELKELNMDSFEGAELVKMLKGSGLTVNSAMEILLGQRDTGGQLEPALSGVMPEGENA